MPCYLQDCARISPAPLFSFRSNLGDKDHDDAAECNDGIRYGGGVC